MRNAEDIAGYLSARAVLYDVPTCHYFGWNTCRQVGTEF
ncbi:Hypothetical protein Cul05146_2105 [Corynebacterium ulcerans]|uniref:Uncharacterized protein n=1 Tax=Corynebacterium ulcerans FRC58 TaxID=1408268 RepID=A0ABN4H304_CORUL|nr:Hypothetical protein Cul05146_2105 [Corynebacterium ulcerans]AKN77992.1 Hypothetical protein CulFRC58_2138 [Corynebacterium ulcerans FRC58]